MHSLLCLFAEDIKCVPKFWWLSLHTVCCWQQLRLHAVFHSILHAQSRILTILILYLNSSASCQWAFSVLQSTFQLSVRDQKYYILYKALSWILKKCMAKTKQWIFSEIEYYFIQSGDWYLQQWGKVGQRVPYVSVPNSSSCVIPFLSY